MAKWQEYSLTHRRTAAEPQVTIWIMVDAETMQDYHDLNFPQFPLDFVEDENETALS